VIVAAFDIA